MSYVSVGESSGLDVKLAATRNERLGAFGLIYRSYVRAGLCEPNDVGLRATPYQLLPTTDIFIAQWANDVVGTLSLIRDGELGLPMEEIYSEEVRSRRDAGLRLAEVSCLADHRECTSDFFCLFCDLARLMAQLAIKLEIDQLLIAVHPRHAPLYRRYMTFQQIGNHRAYPTVRRNPAVALALDLRTIHKQRSEKWERFFGEPLPAELLQPQPISNADRTYFEALIDMDSPANWPHVMPGWSLEVRDEVSLCA